MFIGGCWPGECHYITNGNYHAWNLVQLCRKILEHIGINPERLRLEWLSASEGIRFAEVMNAFTKKLKQIGPLGKGDGIEENELKSKLEKVSKLIPYIKLVKKDKLALHLEENAYSELYTSDEVDTLFREVISYHIDPGKCQACMICYRKCPAVAIIGGKNQIHVIDQDKCIKCGTCYEACPTRFSAVNQITGEMVPPPLLRRPGSSSENGNPSPRVYRQQIVFALCDRNS